MVRKPLGEMQGVGGVPGSDGVACDWWQYEDLFVPHSRLAAAAGFDRDEVTVTAITYEEMRRGCWNPRSRLDDMDMSGIEGSLCFPTFPRSCGRTFSEAKEKDLALLCVRACNDWMVDEWCAGSGGRLIPLCVIPLWDVNLAAQEVRRNAAQGVRAVCFSEIPPFLGLPSIHDVDRDLRAHRFVVEDAVDLGGCAGRGRLDAHMRELDVVARRLAVLGAFARFPDLVIAYSEGRIGWIPYILERADHVYGCFFSDEFGLKNIEAIDPDNVTFECDYPHSDSTWPHTMEDAKKMTAGLPAEVVESHACQRHSHARSRSVTATPYPVLAGHGDRNGHSGPPKRTGWVTSRRG